MEAMKSVVYYDNLLTCNCTILQNIIDLTDTIHNLQNSGAQITKEDISRLSPYMTGHIKRFGDYILDLDVKPSDVEKLKNIPLFT